jgi:hypothetical protein
LSPITSNKPHYRKLTALDGNVLKAIATLGQMAALPISSRSELSQELAAVLSPDHELFAAEVASGRSYREAARRAGFHEDNGFRLMQMPAVRARVEELVNAPEERIRAGIDGEFLMLRNRAANEDLDVEGRANIELRLKLLMAHARYRGFIVEKKQIARASIDLGKAEVEDLRTHIGQYLDLLEPGARQEIEARIARLRERRPALMARGELEGASGTVGTPCFSNSRLSVEPEQAPKIRSKNR